LHPKETPAILGLPSPFFMAIDTDPVNHPSHYTQGRLEAIDVIEDAIISAPEPVQGFLQGQALKYLLRLWLKGNSLEDARKAQWYLTRLILRLQGGP
jgi:hypothetical protein